MKGKQITKERLQKLIKETLEEMNKTLDNKEWKRLHEYYLGLKKLQEELK